MNSQLFCSKVGSHRDEDVGAVHGESSSVSIGDLWPEIDNLDEAGGEGTSMTPTQSPRGDPASCPRLSSGGQKEKCGRIQCMQPRKPH
jgi:hypothetical protein